MIPACKSCISRDFNPRAPCGARRLATGAVIPPNKISTHAPLAGRDLLAQTCLTHCRKFQPTRPLRGATQKARIALSAQCISTHAPLAGRDSKSVQITMYIFAITDKFQMLLHKMPPVRALCFFSMQKNHADLGANRPGDLCALALRTIRSSAPREDTSAYSQSVRFYSRTSCPGSKTAGCPFPGR